MRAIPTGPNHDQWPLGGEDHIGCPVDGGGRSDGLVQGVGRYYLHISYMCAGDVFW
ncbi:hypothetical protein YGS_C3P0029 (plasmid) [Sphingobium sp. YG1]|nr:hypothetical protein YGS_C3P0029 [Sphingobium sp. YG1]